MSAWRFERVESPCGCRERSSTWRSASGAPVRPEGRVPHPKGWGVLPEGSWLQLSLPPRLALTSRLTLLSQGVGVPDGSPAFPKDRWRSQVKRRGVSPRRTTASRKRRTKPKFVRPEVWPTPAGRTDLRSLTKPRQRQHHLARVRALQLRFAATPWS